MYLLLTADMSQPGIEPRLPRRDATNILMTQSHFYFRYLPLTEQYQFLEELSDLAHKTMRLEVNFDFL
jgi:hypothetical protein